jgi:hypothetical protein
LSVAPTSAAVTVGNTQSFTATGRDQYGAVIAAPVNWTVTGGGSIDASSGVFTATTTGGPFTVTATSTTDATISGTAAITVAPATAPPVLTSLSVAPTSATVTVGNTQSFTATGRDQYGAVIAAPVNWTVTGGGIINGSGVFTASTAGGPFTVRATSTANGSITATAGVTVTDTVVVPPGNLALTHPVVISSQDGTLNAANAVDGNATTRWGSAEGVDPQWIYVDLGASYPINHVVLKWEAAYARSYQIQVSNNASSWTTVFTTTTGNGATDDISFASVNARYVRMNGTRRATIYGYSLWEFEVYGG